MENFSENIVEFYERLSSWEQAVVKDSGLTLQQMHTIEIIGNHGTLKMKELASKLGVVMGTLTVMINRLSQMGLVERKSSKDDKRSFIISLTKAGNALHEEHHEHHDVLAEELSSHITVSERKTFNTILTKLLKNM
ncbi:MAG: MarR family transcriptional regulator [Fibrobacterales bacterium]